MLVALGRRRHNTPLSADCDLNAGDSAAEDEHPDEGGDVDVDAYADADGVGPAVYVPVVQNPYVALAFMCMNTMSTLRTAALTQTISSMNAEFVSTRPRGWWPDGRRNWCADCSQVMSLRR